MKVTIIINGQIYERDIDPNRPSTIHIEPQNGQQHKKLEYIEYPFHVIEREITYDAEGNITDIKDRNISSEARAEIRRQNKVKYQLAWKKAPLWIKLLTLLIVSGPFLFLLYLLLTT